MIQVFGRYEHTNTSFLPLPSSYNQSDGVIRAQVDLSDTGSFVIVFGYPDLESEALSPTCRIPIHGQFINQGESVILEWTPEGFFTHFTLQIASDSLFENLLLDERNLRSTIYSFKPAENITYYWRVKTHVQGYSEWLESDWSQFSMFHSTDGYLELTAPVGGETWVQGENHFIRWDDIVGEDIVVELYNNHQFVEELTVTESDGAWRWSVPADLETGCLYKVRISSAKDPGLNDESPGYFSIVDTMGNAPCGVGIIGWLVEPEILVSKVPGTNLLKVEIGKGSSEMVQVRLHTLLGQTIYQQKHLKGANEPLFIPVQSQRGFGQLYILSVFIDNQWVNRKILF
jgi:hypothetical protein